MGDLPLNMGINFDFENKQHPLLIATILEKVLKYSGIADLKNFRLVCKHWNSEALRQLKKVKWKTPTLFETVTDLNRFLKTFGSIPENIINSNLDCGRIIVPNNISPGTLIKKISPVSGWVTGLKTNINIMPEKTFLVHGAFQHLENLAPTLHNFDVRFIGNPGIPSTEDIRPTELPLLPALTSVTIRMDSFVTFDGKWILHPEYSPPTWPPRPKRPEERIVRAESSEHEMLGAFLKELVAKSPSLHEIRLIMSNLQDELDYSHFPPNIHHLNSLSNHELERITHLRLNILDKETISNLLRLAKCGLNKLKYICIDYVFIMDSINPPEEEELFQMLNFQKDSLEYFKLKNSSQDSAGGAIIRLPPIIPRLKVLKLAGNFMYDVNILGFNERFPNLTEIDLTACSFRADYERGETEPLTQCILVKKLKLNAGTDVWREGRTLNQYFPNVNEIKYCMTCRDERGNGHEIVGRFWPFNLEHLVLKVPVYAPNRIIDAVVKPFQLICGITEETQFLDGQFVGRQISNVPWLGGLKTLKIKQRRRYRPPEVPQGKPSGYPGLHPLDCLGYNILSNLPTLEHFSSDLHVFSEKSIIQLKMKIPDFVPGRHLLQ